MAKNTSITFDSSTLVKSLLAGISKRPQEVLTLRFGLGTNVEHETLESIGDGWGITRERVRQIEAAGLDAVRASTAFKEAETSFEELRSYVEAQGSIVSEETLLSELGAGNEKKRNQFRFLLVVGSSFFRERETDEFYARWHVNGTVAKKVHEALSSLYSSLTDKEIVPEAELLNRFLAELKEVNTAYQNEAILKRWLSLSKTIGINPLNEYGRAHAPGVRTKGIRDYAYLVMKQKGEPMHFRQVATAISEMFSKKAHMATTHNELMKDSRFVLVGRGLYALAEWGFKKGVVREVIREILAKKPLTREDILEEVKKVRYVKENTVLMNLSDTRYFKKLANGTYALV